MSIWSTESDYGMELAMWQARGITKEQIMEGQALASKEKQVSVAAGTAVGKPRELVKRMKNAVSTSVGLYEIRMNLFLWGLFRMGKQKGN